MRSESRRSGLTCCGWCAARHASINPSYLTEGYKSTGNNQTTGKNPKVHKGFSPYLACVNKAPKVDIRFFRQEGFSLNEETWVRDIKEKREVTEDDEREADALCKQYLERWKEEQK